MALTNDSGTEVNSEGPIALTTTTWTNESYLPANESIQNASTISNQTFLSEFYHTSPLFETFIIVEIAMTALELLLMIVATCKLKIWRRNYRNQMLMQLSLVRFIKRIFVLIEFLINKKTIKDSVQLSTVVNGAQIYIDFVLVILVIFFIKHMYDSLIVVLVKISQNNLMKVVLCAWLLPLPISVICTLTIVTNVLDHWLTYLLMCAIFRWPLMLVGTSLYISILFRVFTDKIRKFARNLTVITFFLCLVMNLYLFCKDVIWLWCIHTFPTELASYLLGFVMNFLILCLYITLITLSFQCNKNKSCITLRSNLSEPELKR